MKISAGDFFAHLKGTKSDPRWDHPNNVILTLDRSLSPSGDRIFKELRCNGRLRGQKKWPHPGVWSIPEFSEKFIQHLKRSHNILEFSPKKPFSLYLLFEKFIESQLQRFPDKKISLSDFLSITEKLSNFKKLGLTASGAYKALEALNQKTSSADLSFWQECLLTYIQATLLSEEQSSALSSWDTVEQASKLLQTFDQTTFQSAHFWDAFSEVPQFMREKYPFTVIVLYDKDPFPLEQQFLKELGKYVFLVEVEFPMELSESGVPLSTCPSSTLQDIHEPWNENAILWLNTEGLPAPLELLHRLYPLPLDLAFDKKSLALQNMKHTFLVWADYVDSQFSSQHLFKRDASYIKFFSDLKIESKIANPPELLKFFAKEDSPFIALLEQSDISKHLSWKECVQLFLIEELSSLSEYSKATSVDFLESEAFNRASASGIPVLSWGDWIASAAYKIWIWISEKDLHELFQPLSKFHVKRQLFPPELSSYFESEGISVPDPLREAQKTIAGLQLLRSQICVISEKEMASPQSYARIPETPVFERDEYQQMRGQRYSASALQSYLQCPQRYYLERILKLSPAPFWDDEELNPSLTGQWIHKVLEMLHSQNLETLRFEDIYEGFKSSLDGVFKTHMSESFKSLLLKQAENYTDKLLSYIRNFEIPLRKNISLKSFSELSFKAEWQEHFFSGRMDRLDLVLPSQELWIWDYKTGSLPAQTLKGQISKHYFQLPFYKFLIEKGTTLDFSKSIPPRAPVSLLGYLQILQPHKSMIFLFPNLNALTYDFLKRQSFYPTKEVSAEEFAELLATLETNVLESLAGIESGKFPARPFQDSQCPRCPQRVPCGHPYLVDNL